MRKVLYTDKLINCAVIAVVIIIAGLFAFNIIKSYHQTINIPVEFNDDLDKQTLQTEYKYYRTYLEKRQKYKVLQDLRNGNWAFRGSTFVIIGAYTSQYCDTCTIPPKGLTEGTKVYNLILPYWKLKEFLPEGTYLDSTSFYMKHGKGFVSKAVITDKKSSSQWKIKHVDVPVEFRYNCREDFVMIPISANTYDVLFYVILASGITLGIWLLYNILEFIKFSADVSKGYIFTDRNLFRLKIIALTLLGLPLVSFFMNLILGLIFSNYFAGMIILKSDLWKNSWMMLGIGLMFLLLFKAFRKGKLLQEENDLTV